MTSIATTAIAGSLKNQPMLREILTRVAMSMASECMPAVMRVIAQNLISQPKLQKLLIMTITINFPLGMCREHSNRVPAWLTAVLVAIPYISITVNAILMPKATAAYTLAATILGLYLGCMAEQQRLKSIAAMYPPEPQYRYYKY
ncbi:unnamed protein product [Lactuca virosa]|uniref:Uncharacterized protein n=1 Tax=Lactuca virosa TaxID=75947 RepID=A0AAU9P5S1_9ASTR|nr:unnamed protein product [Lactuca virosa]